MKIEDLVVGEIYYNAECNKDCYFAGTTDGIPVFEHIYFHGVKLDESLIPNGWVSKGNNTYWRFKGIEKEFEIKSNN